MIYLVSAYTPPDYSGAGKRIFGYYQYLRNSGEAVCLLTYSINKECIRINRCKWRFVGKILDMPYALLQLFSLNRVLKIDSNDSVLLVAVSFLTNAAAIFFKIKGCRIVTQNTLLGSDEYCHVYNNDAFKIKMLLKRMQYKLSNAVTSVSPDLYEAGKGIHNECSMILNPVSIKFLNIGKCRKFKGERKNVLSVGEVSFRKGYDIIFKTINELHKEKCDINFTIIGPTNKSDRQELMMLYDSLPNIDKSKVEFLGMISDVTAYYEEADVFFLPTRREGFPNVFLEAMSSGLPVLVRSLGMTTDYLFPHNYSLLIDDSKDYLTYKDYLKKVLDDDCFYTRHVRLGMSISEQFVEDKIYAQYSDLLKK